MKVKIGDIIKDKYPGEYKEELGVVTKIEDSDTIVYVKWIIRNDENKISTIDHHISSFSTYNHKCYKILSGRERKDARDKILMESL